MGVMPRTNPQAQTVDLRELKRVATSLPEISVVRRLIANEPDQLGRAEYLQRAEVLASAVFVEIEAVRAAKTAERPLAYIARDIISAAATGAA